MSKRHKQQRKGIILLAIISLLTMFMLIGVTYVVVSGHFKRAALSNAQSRQLGVAPQKHLDSAMYQLVRDTDRAGSIARGHSLLQDKYGHFSVRARIQQAVVDPTTNQYPAGGQILELRIVIDPQVLPTPLTVTSTPGNRGLSMLSLGALNGRVVTFLDGLGQNISGRIIKSSPHIVFSDVTAQYNYTIRLLFPKTITNTIASRSFIGKSLVINGRDFSGTGAGLNLEEPTRYGQLTRESLLPNRSLEPANEYQTYRQGGLNEGYDVPDYQNMSMAALINHPTNRNLQYVLPSFHRPALFNYWVSNRESSPLGSWRETLQRILMRPMPWDNPEFTGGNPEMSLRAILVDGVPGNRGDDDGNGIVDLIVDTNGNGIYDPGDVIDPEELFYRDNNGNNTNDNFEVILGARGVFPWDVDNDGDGAPDSIWVDLGLPIQTDESGRKFKPLFAILCTDMDGRLNLNAHGNQMHYLADAANSGGVDHPLQLLRSPRGLGFGPAEISLHSILPSVAKYRQLLVGIPNQTNGRYGNNLTVGVPGIDLFSKYIFNGYPISYPDQQFSSFQTITDIHGELVRGINTAGNPVSQVPGVPANLSTLSNYGLPNGNRHVIADNPYELNLVAPKVTDQIFTPQELEKVLRFRDSDNPLQPSPGPDGVWGNPGDDDGNGVTNDMSEALAVGSDDGSWRWGSFITNEANRRAVTTASFDAPTPTVQIPENLRDDGIYEDGGHTAHLLRAKIRAEIRRRGNATPQDAALLQAFGIYHAVAAELALNKMMLWSKGPDGVWGNPGDDDGEYDDLNGAPLTDDPLEAGWPGSDDRRSPLLDIGIFDGQKMDVNRPFGNGMDDNGDGVVDNFIESTGAERWPNIFNATPVFMDHDNDGIFPEPGDADGDGIFPESGEGAAQNRDAFLARYHYARQLYVLTMLVNERDDIDFDHDDIDFEQNPIEGYSGPNEKEYNIAQWAANVVDFRDVDAIMTPFEFDINPFNGWDVDGIIGTADDAHPERALVWGCERPELLISESIVFHDRRTEDLSNEQPFPAGDQAAQIGQMGETNSDQRLLPRSGAFFELYNPWFNPTSDATAPASGSWAPAEFYRDVTTGDFTNGIRLNQTTLNTDADGNRSPVFRLIVVRGDDQDLDPDAFEDAFKPNANSIERAIYFTDNAAEIPTLVDDDRNGREQFFTTFKPRPLLGGQYAVIGSSGIDPTTGKPHDPPHNNNARYTTFIGRRNDAIAGGGHAQLNYLNTRQIELIPDPDVLVQARIHNNNNPPYGDKTNTAINANIPVVGLPINQHIYGGNTSPLSLTLTEPVGGYPQRIDAVPGLDGELEFNPPLDRPLDYANNPNPTNPIINNGTTPKFSVVHLQRLANPLQPYDPTTNPYRTIDTHSVDVTAFNGVENEHPDDAALSPREDFFRFHSHQRGDADVIAAGMGGQPSRNLWQAEPHSQPVPVLPPGVVPPPGNDDDHIFRHPLKITLGYLNSTYGNPTNDGRPDATTGHHFPWLQWNNRPFVSSLELMQVPYSKSSRLLFDYTFDRNGTIRPNGQRLNPYVVGPNGLLDHEYGHLLNFFESGDNTANFQRIFDFLHTPSPYTGAYTYLNPVNFGSGLGTDELHPPFNKVSNFRDPGKININTIFDPNVYLGLFNGHRGPNYRDWIDSRRGYGAAGTDLVSFDSDKPSLFTNPIRPSSSGDIVPLPGLERSDIELSLLRSNKIGRNQTGTNLLVNSPYPEEARNSQRNSSFKYQSVQRLDNLVTGRSNVFGVWITMGYFEITTANPTPENPDGYQLGQEIGIDRGEIRRHRAFYMIDRSIPAAFEPGENHNVDKTVILRRYID